MKSGDQRPTNEQPVPVHGMFLLSFNNRKKRGRYPLRECVCEGTLYSDNHVNLNTSDLPVHDFLSVQQMQEYVEAWGDCTVTWLEEG